MADTSSMAGESTQVADRNKMAAQRPDASVLPQKVGRPPKNFKGCKCQKTKCNNGNCICFRSDYPCTWKCECRECENSIGTRGSDSTTRPGSWCKCMFSRCLNNLCQCMKDSHGCSSKCECENCGNPKGVRGSEPEQDDDTSSMARKPPQRGSRGASKRPRTE